MPPIGKPDLGAQPDNPPKDPAVGAPAAGSEQPTPEAPPAEPWEVDPDSPAIEGDDVILGDVPVSQWIPELAPDNGAYADPDTAPRYLKPDDPRAVAMSKRHASHLEKANAPTPPPEQAPAGDGEQGGADAVKP